MITKEEILEILAEIITDPKFFVVEVKVSPSKIRKKITILMDSDEGLLVDDCASVSRQLGVILEEKIEEAFTLEVSSPGVDFPITTRRQLDRVVGKELKVILRDEKEIMGVLLSSQEEVFELKPQKKKKEKVAPEPIKIRLDEMKEAYVQVSFK
jgi:ribosome maturation factor RimP